VPPQSFDDQIKELDSELENLQKGFVYKVDSERELLNFILEARAHQFAITNLVGSILAKMNNSNLHSEKQRYEVFMKSKLIELMKKWLEKYGRLPGASRSSTN